MRRHLIAGGALAGGALGIVVALTTTRYCRSGPGLSLICYYKSVLGWETSELIGNVTWITIGAVVGGLAGLILRRFMVR